MNGNALMERPVYVVGAGGIGIIMAWCLIKAGKPVKVIESNLDKINFGNINGLNIHGHEPLNTSFIHFNDWQPEPHSVILLCTKTYTNELVLSKVPETSKLIPVQNGFDQLLESRNHVAEGIVSFVSECDADTTATRITRQGDFHLGPRTSPGNHDIGYLSQLAQLLGAAGLFSVHQVDDIKPYKYTKLMYNAAISPLAASAGIDNSGLLNHPVAKKLFIALLKENYLILQHAGIALEKIGPLHPDLVYKILKQPMVINLFAIFFKPSLRGTYCSMAPDIHTDKTEIDAYNGHLIKLAGDLPCPINRAAVEMVNTIVANRSPPGIHHLSSLAGVLPEGTLA